MLFVFETVTGENVGHVNKPAGCDAALVGQAERLSKLSHEVGIEEVS
jgi:hypothetical protein